MQIMFYNNLVTLSLVFKGLNVKCNYSYMYAFIKLYIIYNLIHFIYNYGPTLKFQGTVSLYSYFMVYHLIFISNQTDSFENRLHQQFIFLHK